MNSRRLRQLRRSAASEFGSLLALLRVADYWYLSYRNRVHTAKNVARAKDHAEMRRPKIAAVDPDSMLWLGAFEFHEKRRQETWTVWAKD
jgi:hypothetical protein